MRSLEGQEASFQVEMLVLINSESGSHEPVDHCCPCVSVHGFLKVHLTLLCEMKAWATWKRLLHYSIEYRRFDLWQAAQGSKNAIE